MFRWVSNAFEQFRQPEYTGENRCTPCTILNVTIAFVLAGGIGLVFPPAGVATFVVFLAIIYLRGYLVPGTPGITRRYFPERVLRWFDKAPPEARGEAVGTDGGVASTKRNDVGEMLLSARVIEECPDDDDLCLTGSFEEVWWRRIHQVRDEERAVDRLASVLELDPDELSVRTDDESFDVVYDGATIGRWASRAAFIADLAVEPTLAEWVYEWDDLDDRQRTSLIANIRVFLEECPSCDADLKPVEDTVRTKSCCSTRTRTKVTIDCQACGDRIFDGMQR